MKIPLGELIPDKNVTRAALLSRIGPLSKHGKNARIIVTIGDRTSERLHQFSIPSNIEIVDGMEKRVERLGTLSFNGDVSRILEAENRAGTISSVALSVLAKSLALIEENPAPVRVNVKGEEDLLTLPIIAYFPPETIAMYGQPNEGLVIVEAKGKPRIESWDILARIGITSLSA